MGMLERAPRLGRAVPARRRMIRDEAGMARVAVRVGAVAALPIVATAGVLRGSAAALTALGAVLLVVASFYVTGRSLTWAASRGPAMLLGVALGGYLVRLSLYGTLLILLRPIEAIDGPVLAISLATAVVVVLAYEVRLVTSHPELWWLRDGKEHA